MEQSPKVQIGFLVLITVLVNTGFGIIFPIFPKLLQELHRGATDLGLLAAAFGISSAIFSPIFGRLADQHGKPKIILLGMLGFSLSNGIYVVAWNYWIIMVGRTIEGMFASAVVPIAISYVSDIVKEEERGKYIGYVTSGAAVGIVIGPILGGFLFKLSIKAPFIMSAGLAIVTWLVGRFLFGKIEVALHHDTTTRKPWHWGMLPQPMLAFLILLLVDMASLLTWVIVEPGFSFYIYDILLLSPEQFGEFVAAYGLAVAFFQSLFGNASDRFGRRPVIFLGMVLNLLFMVLMSIATNFMGLILAAVVAGISLGFYGPAMKALLSDISDDDYRSTIFGIDNSMLSLAIIIGPLVGGHLYDLFGMALVFHISIIIAAVGLLLTLFLKFRHEVGNSSSTPASNQEEHALYQ